MALRRRGNSHQGFVEADPWLAGRWTGDSLRKARRAMHMRSESFPGLTLAERGG